ncbi:uncharacterized protein BDZ83DRAFT_746717 [Colletotrichum acutatum]|uniref:Uncharacterized protein n=1 Tax=Glomerella acutata TaxID=27357 RepID=A0AAD8XPQ5_GLOAC|nr:uncharacterized protein BDZ83DRAFT_746717 [Colletotrichum acutatum]KAK1731323.1 hypothetical protein BDZ83DRAFT_746717 [Colletotrichum acutatum]
MAEQPKARDLSESSAHFRSALQNLTHEWGFVVARTAYVADNDEAQWAAAEKGPNTLALPVRADSNVLCGADYAFHEEWPSDVCRDAFVLIDQPALTSLLNAPVFIPGTLPNLDLKPWIVAVDAKDPASVPYAWGGPCIGLYEVARACSGASCGRTSARGPWHG